VKGWMFPAASCKAHGHKCKIVKERNDIYFIRMKIAIAQNNYVIGALEDNVEKIIRSIRKARQEKAALVVFSELAVCGYPPHDLLEYKHFVEKCAEAMQQIAAECHGIAAIVGGPSVNPNSKGKNLYNSAFFLANGSVRQVIHKTLLPTYDIFDEYRYFEQNTEFGLVSYKGFNIAITICEDLWYRQPILTGYGKDRLYSVCPMDKIAALCPDFMINIAASPFSYLQGEIKTGILTENATRYKLPIYYVNQVGAQTDLIFDGGSMVVNPTGIISRMKEFEEDFATYETDVVLNAKAEPFHIETHKEISQIHNALVLGIRDYFVKSGLKTAIVGLSGGIDSAVTLALAVRALGAMNVRGLLMPSQFSSDHSVTDAVVLARNLGVRYDVVDIRDIFGQYNDSLNPVFRGLAPDITEENIQARIRGNLLMALSNKFGCIVLNTSNKSEAAVGYGTLYGDMSGALSVLGDVYKTDVYRLAEYINLDHEVIPKNSITKPPSAELRPDQKDSDSLPDYNILDQILYHYIELKKSEEEIVQLGFDPGTVNKSLRMVNHNEYKRYQTPPVLRISTKAFGPGRKMPLVAKY
jgi:NAD+ synthase (glutamine-hydrolysing)